MQGQNNPYEKSFEAIPQESEKTSEYYSNLSETWTSTMSDIEAAQEKAQDATQESTADIGAENETEKTGTADILAGYGLDVACREYTLDTVLRAIIETDETGADMEKPIAAVYKRLAPDAEERRGLFDNIQKNEEYQSSAKLTNRTALEQQQAVSATKELVNLVRTSPKFEVARRHAAEAGKDIIAFLIQGKVDPTLSDLLERIDANADIEEVAEELVEEAEAQFRQEREDNSGETDVDAENQEAENL